MLLLLILFVLGIHMRAAGVTIYSIVTSGTCADKGYGYIADRTACQAAARQVGWSDQYATLFYTSSYPRGCFDRSSSTSGGSLYFNERTSSTRSCAPLMACLCAFAAPACPHGDGATANPAPCVCGASGACTSATGLFCDMSNNNRCSLFPTCASTDGTADNPSNCVCGTTDCDAATTGLFCYSPLSQCSTSNSFVVGSFTGPVCAHGDGATANPAPCVCGASGACTSATGLFCDMSNNNRCSLFPTCASTDGTADNPSNCACGTTDCDAATTGPFCFANDNRCRFVACATADGTAANPRDCACGTTDCNDATTGLFCFADDNRCRFAACATTDGTAANPSNCACGTADCDASTTGLFCYSPRSQCSTSNSFIAYPIVTSGTCADQGYGWIADAATCEAAAGQVGWSDTTAYTYSSSSYPRGCFDRRSSSGGGYLNFNPNTASTRSCNYNSKACLCAFTAPACAHGDGATADPAPCVCGASGACTSTTGLFCDAAKNQCDDVPYCATTDGTAANPANCACGTTDCDAATTGLFCFADDNRCRFVACANTDGTAANSANCACGSTDCDAATTGLFCDASKNQCDDVPYCATTDGTAANPANCACGTTDCDAATTGLICDTSNNDRCSAVPTCATTDGTAANPANCACGTTDCDAATTGLFCDSSKSSCSKIQGLHTTVYPIVTSGTCASNGYGNITDKATCGAAAGQAGWSTTAVQVPRKRAWSIQGCYLSAENKPEFNSLVSDRTTGCGLSNIDKCHSRCNEECGGRCTQCCSPYGYCGSGKSYCPTGSDLVTDDYIIATGKHYYKSQCSGCGEHTCTQIACGAVTAPICPNGNAASANAGPCICGASACTVATGLFCDASKSRCSRYPNCENADGTERNEEACECGTQGVCTASTGLFCDGQQCASRVIPYCLNTVGTAANANNCACGDEDCYVENNGPFCFANDNRCRFGTCATTDGSASNDNNCACGTADCNTATGFFCHASGNNCQRFISCSNADGQQANAENCTCGTTDCAAATTGLFCHSPLNQCSTSNSFVVGGFTGPACEHGGGSANNPAPCVCGASACTAATGLFCDASKSSCSKIVGPHSTVDSVTAPDCPYRDGAFLNAASCICNAMACTSATGLFCDASKSSCSKIEGPHSQMYPRIHVGTCASNGFSVLTSMEKCSTAVGTDVLNRNYDDYPQGCLVDNGDTVIFNSPETGVTCDLKIRECICDTFAPICPNGNGMLYNVGPCICGASACTGATGLFCDASKSRCSRYPICENADGTEQNGQPCECGTQGVCTASTGLFCDGQQCASRVIPYCLNTVGTAENANNCACGDEDCYVENNGPFCFANDNRCRFGRCTTTDGSAANPANCACGTADCDTATGFFCHASDNKCQRFVSCSNTDGQQANAEDCTCGTSDCTRLAGRYCNIEAPAGDQCTTFGGTYDSGAAAYTCLNTVGTIGNRAGCICGNTQCTVETGIHCNVALHQCSLDGRFAVEGQTQPACPYNNGLRENSGDCVCGSSLCTSGNLFCDVSQSQCNPSAYCSNDDGSEVNIRTCTCGIEECSENGGEYSGLVCTSGVCSRPAACIHTDGLTPNEQPCACGPEDCSFNNGFICDLDRCVLPKCSDIDGVQANARPCQCGDSECSEYTGLHCLQRESLCADRFAFAYDKEITSGTCASNGLLNHTTHCDDSYPCICKGFAGPLCENTAGFQPNMYQCICGDNVCQDGEYCADGTCNTNPLCTNTDGTIQNQSPCVCGTETCATFYCNVNEASVCADLPRCGANDGLLSNPTDCQCGSSPCTAASGRFCFGSICSEGPVCGSTRCGYGEICTANVCEPLTECHHDSGLGSNTNQCMCGANACGAGDYCIAEKNQCTPSRPCLNVLGVQINDEACLCGTEQCQTSNYCTQTLNFCSAHSTCTDTSVEIVRNCISWRNTGACDPDGPREPESDMLCNVGIAGSASGYCECESGRRLKYGCGHGPIRCDVECAKGSTQYQPMAQTCTCGTDICESGEYCRMEHNQCSKTPDTFLIAKSGTCASLSDFSISDEATCRRAWYEITGEYDMPANVQCVNSGACTAGSPCICWTGNTEPYFATCPFGVTTGSCTCELDTYSCKRFEGSSYLESDYPPSSSPCTDDSECESVGSCTYSSRPCQSRSHASGSWSSWSGYHIDTNCAGLKKRFCSTDGGCSNARSYGRVTQYYDTRGQQRISGTCTTVQDTCHVYPDGEVCNPGQSCNEHGYQCEDVVSTPCADTNGTMLNEVATCKCGSTYCDLTDGLYCIDIGDTSRCTWTPPCASQDGLQFNTDECTCGTDVCQLQYCILEENLCTTTPPCAKKNPYTANTGECRCGETTCTSQTGLYCSASENTCLEIATCQYDDGLLRNGEDCGCNQTTCDFESGRYCIASVSMCSAFASCEHGGGNITNPSTCTCRRDICQDGGYCWEERDKCSLYPACANLNGSTPNDSECTCGIADCTSGDYCWEDRNKCSAHPDCIDGTGANNTELECTCGISDCWSGDYCWFDTNHCSPHPACNANGSVSNPDMCTCGISECAADQYCNDGTCQDIPVCVQGTNVQECTCADTNCTEETGFECSSGVCTPGTCADVEGSQPNARCVCDLNECSPGEFCLNSQCSNYSKCIHADGIGKNDAQCICGTAECAPGFTYCSDNVCYPYPLCNETSGLVQSVTTCICPSNGAACDGYCSNTLQQCSYDGIFTVSENSGPVCNSTDTHPPRACFCGTNYCELASPGLICNSATNTCERPPKCNETLGLAPNDNYCACGTADCHNTTGLYCRESMNQCSANGRFFRDADAGYIELGAGACNSVRYLQEAYTDNTPAWEIEHSSTSCGSAAVPPIPRNLQSDRNYIDCLNDVNEDNRQDCDPQPNDFTPLPAINCEYYNKWLDAGGTLYPPLGDGTTGPCTNSYMNDDKRRPWGYSDADVTAYERPTGIVPETRNTKMIQTCMHRCRKRYPDAARFQIHKFKYTFYVGSAEQKVYNAILDYEEYSGYPMTQPNLRYCVQYSPRINLGQYSEFGLAPGYFHSVYRNVFYPSIFLDSDGGDLNLAEYLEVSGGQYIYQDDDGRTELRCNCVPPESECELTDEADTSVYTISIDSFPPRQSLMNDPILECKDRCGTRQWFLRNEDSRCACVGDDGDCSRDDEDILKFTRYASGKQLPVCDQGPNVEHCICGPEDALCEAGRTGLYCDMEVCSKPQNCTRVDGIFENENGCMCGEEECWSGNGLFCHTDRCMPFGACEVTNGTLANLASPECFCKYDDSATTCRNDDVYCNGELQQCRATSDFDVYVFDADSISVTWADEHTPAGGRCTTRTKIRSAADCTAAFAVLPGYDTYACRAANRAQSSEINDPEKPPGCFFRAEPLISWPGTDCENDSPGSQLYFNTAGLDDGENSNACTTYTRDSDEYPTGTNRCLCNTPTTFPACPRQAGYHEFTLNQDACLCNAELCSWGQNKMVCDEGECTRPPVCENTAGTVANMNVTSCSCGNTHCMNKTKYGDGISEPRAYDGFYCRLDSVGPYYLADRCDLHPVCEELHGTNATDYTCMCAAETCDVGEYCALGQSIVYGADVESGAWSAGKFSPTGMSAPLCVHTNGSVPCLCGASYTECTPKTRVQPDTLDFSSVGTGLSCLFEASACERPAECANGNGTVLNDVATCACGNVDCWASSGMYCFKDEHMCKPEPLCTNRYGADPVAAPCTCQHETCNTGQYCHDDDALYTNYMFYLDRNSVPACRNLSTCADTIGTGANEPCYCEFDKCDDNAYCYQGKCWQYPLCTHTDGQTKNTGDCTCGQNECVGDSAYCYQGKCLRYPLCEHTNGVDRNGANCTCGEHECAKPYCHDYLDNLCSDEPKCAHEDGSTLNTNKCWCNITSPSGVVRYKTDATSVQHAQVVYEDSGMLSGQIVGLEPLVEYAVSWEALGHRRDSYVSLNNNTMQESCSRGVSCEYVDCSSMNVAADEQGRIVVQAQFELQTECACSPSSGVCYAAPYKQSFINATRAALRFNIILGPGEVHYFRTCEANHYCQNTQDGHGRCDVTADTFPVATSSGFDYHPQCDIGVEIAETCVCEVERSCVRPNYCLRFDAENHCSVHPKCQHSDGITVEDENCACSPSNVCNTRIDPTCNSDGTCSIPECVTGGSGSRYFDCTCRYPCTDAQSPFDLVMGACEQDCGQGAFCYNMPPEFGSGERGCLNTKPVACDGSGTEQNDAGALCLCGKSVFCREFEYCNDNFETAQCSPTPNPSCANIHGEEPNGDGTCICGTETCQAFEYCNATSTTQKCYKQYCRDYLAKQPEFCNRRGTRTELREGTNGVTRQVVVDVPYGNNLVALNKTCDATHVEGECTDDSYLECCLECPPEFTFNQGSNQCLSDCDYTICQGKWVEPPFGWLISIYGSRQWDRQSVQEDLNTEWTGFCQGACDSADQKTCCVEAKKCTAEDPYSLCREEKHNRKFIDDATCANHLCTTEQCCEVVECNCTGGVPKNAFECSAHGARECQGCYDDHWQDGLQCHPITICGDAQYQSVPPKPGRRNRQCAELSLCDTVSEYISTNETRDSTNMALTDRQCSTRTVCAHHEYQVRVPTVYQDRVCSALRECDDDQYGRVERDGTLAISDTECRQKTACSDDQYIYFDGNTTTDRECRTISPECTPPTVQTQAPIPGQQNRYCQTPVHCTSDQYESQAPTNTSDRECTALTVCTANEYQSSPPNSTSDRTCTDLTVCRTADQYESVAATNTSDRLCATLTVCDPNNLEYETTAPNATRDRVCAQCANASCKTCTTDTDCDYAPGKIHDPSKCSNYTCIRYKAGKDAESQKAVISNYQTHFKTVDPVLDYGLYYRFDVVSDMAFVISGIAAYTKRTLRDNVQISNNEYLYFYIPMGHVGDITYKALGTSPTTFLVKRNCNQTIKYMGSKDGKQVCTSVCGGPGAILVKRTTVYGAIGGGTPCLPVWTSTPCLCVPQGECPADFNGTCVHTDCQCPVHCEYEKSAEFGPCDAACGEKGVQSKNITIKTAPQHGGTACPPNEEQECTGAPDEGKCDCDGHTLDRCGVCGGHNECRGCDGIYYTVRGYKIPVMDECGNCPCTNRNNPRCASSEQKRACREKMKLKGVRKTERSDTVRRNAPLYAGISIAVLLVIIIAFICRPKKTSYIPVAAHDPGASFEHMDNLLRF